MNREEAKMILSALRVGETETPDREIAEALQLAESDEVLGKWFAESQVFDQVMTDRLRTIPVPAHLRSDILSGLKFTRRPRMRRQIIITPLAAAAAAAAVVLGFALWHTADPSGSQIVNEFQRDMMKEIEGLTSIDYISDNPEKVTDYLKSRNFLLGIGLPNLIGSGKLAGCKIVNWKGHRVSLICFSIPSEKGMPSVHLMTMDAGAMDQLKNGAENRMIVNGWSSTVWRSGDRVYLIAMKNGEERNLRGLVPLG